MIQLKERSCKPCTEETAPLDGLELKKYETHLPAEWQLVDGHHLHREYNFEGWREAVAFTINAAELADQANHHPYLTLSYGKVLVKLFTHKIDGLSENDFILAARLKDEFQKS